MVGIDPGPFTLRELLWMARARSSTQWDHTAALLCQTANIYRDRNSPPRTYQHFHPFLSQTLRRGMTVDQLHAMRSHADHVVTITLSVESQNDSPPP